MVVSPVFGDWKKAQGKNYSFVMIWQATILNYWDAVQTKENVFLQALKVQ